MEEILRAFNPWWEKEPAFPGIPRKKYTSLLEATVSNRDIILLSGLRRVGKTTIMKQYIHNLISGGTDPDRVLYVSLDNIALRDHRIHEIVKGFRVEKNLSIRDDVFLFLDEVHLKPDFEQELKNLYDIGHCKIFASGSESMTLTLRTPYLTGRHRIIKVRPLDLTEYMDFKGVKVSPSDEHLMVRIAEEYAKDGGLPEYVLSGDLNYLNTTIEAILFRDILTRTNIKERTSLLEILQMIARNVSTPLSIRRISRVLSHSEATVRNVVSLLMEADLIHPVGIYGKFTQRMVNPSKFYLADTGFFRALQERTNMGFLVENLVFIHLKDQGTVNYYRGEQGEIDFISGRNAIEVKYKDSFDDEEPSALYNKKGSELKIMITRSLSGSMGKGVEAIPLHRFLRGSNIAQNKRSGTMLKEPLP